MTPDSENAEAASSPPSPDGLPFLGNAFAFARDPIDAMEEWASLGDLVRLEIPGQTTYLVTGPDLIEQILVDDHQTFAISQAQRETFSGIEDHAVTTTTGDRWRRLRRALQPAFTPEAMDRYTDSVVRTTAASIEEWDDGEQLDLFREMRLLTVRVLADALLDVDVRGDEDIIMDASDALVDRANFRRPGQLVPDWIPTPTDRRFKRRVQRLDAFVDDIIAERRTAGLGEDVCSVLLEASDAGRLSDAEVRHNIVALLLAGHDSPSVALTHALRLLDDHPAHREALVTEVREVVEGDSPTGVEYEDLECTRNVVSEALRLYPPTLGVSRQATAPVQLAGYELPAGTEFLLPQWVVHRDDRFWDEPTTFDPSRWQEPADRPDYAYFPFSGGPRNCVGGHFARLELTLVLATMVEAVGLDVSMDGPLTFTPSLQLRPEPAIEATVRRR